MGDMNIPEKDEKPQFVDSAGRPSETAPGPRGARMSQLGILTRAQLKKPQFPKIRQTMDGKPVAGDVENFKAHVSLAEKAREQLTQQMAAGPANTISESDPMKKSLIARSPMMRAR